MLEEPSARETFDKAKDNSSSLIFLIDTASLLSRKTQSTDTSARLSTVFPSLDTQLISTAVYQKAVRSLFRLAVQRGKRNAHNPQASPPPFGMDAGLENETSSMPDVDRSPNFNALGERGAKMHWESFARRALYLTADSAANDDIWRSLTNGNCMSREVQLGNTFEHRIITHTLEIVQSRLTILEKKGLGPFPSTQRFLDKTRMKFEWPLSSLKLAIIPSQLPTVPPEMMNEIGNLIQNIALTPRKITKSDY